MSTKTIILLFILGFFIGLLVLCYVPSYTNHLKSDDWGYDVMAYNMLSGHGFSGAESPPFDPNVTRTPGYPIFLALIYSLFGRNYNAVFIIQIIMSNLTALLVYFIAFKSFVSYKKQIASLAYILVLFCPFLWFLAKMLFTETLFTFLVTLSILLITVALERNSYWLFFTSGLITGIALLTRPTLSLLPIFLVLLIILAGIKKDKFSSLVKKNIVYITAVMLIWSPWIIRNYIVFKEFIPLTAGISGAFFYMGTLPPYRYSTEFFYKEEEKRFDDYLSKAGNTKAIIALDNEYKKDAFKRIKEMPLTYFKYTLQRIPILWLSSFSHYFGLETPLRELRDELRNKILQKQNFMRELMFILIKLSLIFINILYVSTAVVGIVLLSKYWRKYYPLLIIPLYFTLIYTVLGRADARYALPAYPIMLIFSAYALLSFYNWIKTHLYRI